MKNFWLACLSIAVVLVMGEVGLRYIGKQLPLDVLVKYVPVKSEQGLLLNPDSGSAESNLQPAIQYHYVSHHLRDTPVNPNATPILVLGDAFTFGWLLPWEKTFVHHLQQSADKQFGKNKYQFLNAGTPSFGTLDQLKFLETEGAAIAPKAVIVFLNTDDIGESIAEDTSQLPETDLALMIQNSHPLESLTMNIFYNSWLYSHSVLLNSMHKMLYNILHQDDVAALGHVPIPESVNLPFQDDFAVRYGEDLFLRMNKWCKEHHATLLVVTTGFNAFYPADAHDPTKVFLTKARSFFEREQIPYEDIASGFKKAVAGKNFQMTGTEYPNEIGARIIAEKSAPWIMQHLVS